MHKRLPFFRPAMAGWLILALSSASVAQEGEEAPPPAPVAKAKDIRFVVFHTPGPTWDAGKGMREQPGLQDHLEHYRKLLEAGKLASGGPFLDGKGGGMMILAPGTPEDEAVKLAEEDPAVKSGLLTFEVRRWLVGMSQRGQ